jgi:hypothetical protein
MVVRECAMTINRIVVFAEPVRTAIGTHGGGLKNYGISDT